ncbi:hypothetical protein M426DRAFT_26734 [Hypoxylon sp. CI-4A]|nr:hypothetical protein M426DRAFT_26734 [Hypoxylon sp. CI-4A]
MLVTPWIQAVIGEPPESLVRDLAPDSTTMTTLREDFSNASAKLEIVSCYELRETPTSVKQEDGSLKRCGPPGMMVRKASACLSWENEEKIPINENHSMIAKLSRREGSAYHKVKDAVLNLVINARKVVPNQFRRRDISDYVRVITSTSETVRRYVQSREPHDSEMRKSLDEGLARMCDMCSVLIQEQFSDFFLGQDVPIAAIDRIKGAIQELAQILPATLRGWLTQEARPPSQSPTSNQSSDHATLYGPDSVFKLADRVFRLTEILQQILSLRMLEDPHARALNFQGSESPTRDSGLAYIARQQDLFRSTNQLQPAKSLPGTLQIASETSTPGGITLGRYWDNGNDQYVIVEYRQYSTPRESGHPMSERELNLAASVKAQTQKLAALLSQSDFRSGIHMLKCLGFVDEDSVGRLAFLYNVPGQLVGPDGTLHKRVLTLKQAIRKLSRSPLEIRFGLAYQVAVSLLNVHSCGWVHKNICSRNIICVLPKDREIIPKPTHWDVYLKGFESSRGASDCSNLTPEWNENVWYRHPDRFDSPAERFIKKYDIYSIGLVLLEIGTGELMEKQHEKAQSALESGHVLTPKSWKDFLLKSAETMLPATMGSSYAKAVTRCIKGDLHVKSDNPNEVALGLAFQQLVISSIAKGVMI